MATGAGSTCPRCGTSLAPDMRFCPNCGGGAPADAAPRAADDPALGGPPPWEVDAAMRGEEAAAGEAPGTAAGAGAPPGGSTQPSRRSGRAFLALAIGVVGVVVGGLVLGPLAMILGMIARRDVQLDPDLRGEGIARAAIVVGALALALHLLRLIAILGQ